MIKNIFLPEQINGYFLFPKRVVSISIFPTFINATQLYIKGKSYTVEKCLQEQLDPNTTLTLPERTINALKKIKTQLGAFDEVHSVVSSNSIVFKKLKVPFVDYEKIKLIIHFEAEPLLPFPLKDAIIDFVIIRQIPEEQSSEILVVATQKKNIAELVDIFKQADIKLDLVTVDIVSLYNLYQQIPSYNQQKGNVVLLGLDMHATHIGHIYHNQLRTIRTLNKGLSFIIKTVSDKLKLPYFNVMDHFIRFGITHTNQPEITDALKKATDELLQEIRFTLSSFTTQTIKNESIDTILLFGDGAAIAHFASYINANLGILTSVFTIQELIDSKKIIIPSSLLPIINTQVINISTVMPNQFATTASLNLLKDEFSQSSSYLLLKQLGALVLIAAASLALLFTYSMLETEKIKTALFKNTTEAVELLERHFPNKIDIDQEDKESAGTELSDAVDEAEKALKSEELTWIAFSGRSRISFLHYILELTNLIDKKDLGFEIEELTITHTDMTLKAKVTDYPALKKLENELKRSKLFNYKEQQTEPNFTMKILLAKNGQELS